MQRTTTRRARLAAMGVVAALAASACGPNPGGGGGTPGLPVPTPADVVRVSPPDAVTSVHPMSADGRYVAYSLEDESTLLTDAYLWDRDTVQTVALTSGGSAHPPFVSNDGSTVAFTKGSLPRSFFLHSTADGETEQVDLPAATYGDDPIDSVSTSGDGSLVVVSTGTRVLTWTADGGFDELTDPARLLAGTALEYASLGAPVSDSGRYVTVTTYVPTTFSLEPGMCVRPEIHDLQDGSTTVGHCGQVGPLAPPGNDDWFHHPHVLATAEDLSVVYGWMGAGAHAWSLADGFDNVGGSLTAWGWAASPDGNAVGYSIHTGGLGGGMGAGYLLVREPRGRAQLGEGGMRTHVVGIGADVRYVLINSKDPALVGVPAGTTDQSLFLWDRGA
jgi:hypothetical protein